MLIIKLIYTKSGLLQDIAAPENPIAAPENPVAVPENPVAVPEIGVADQRMV